MIDEILTPWRVNNRVNLLLFDHIGDEGMRCTLSSRGGRTVVRQFAHLHNNRIRHLTRRAKGLATDAHLFATHDDGSAHAQCRPGGFRAANRAIDPTGERGRTRSAHVEAWFDSLCRVLHRA